jgi:CRP-like cAMP-binding protein
VEGEFIRTIEAGDHFGELALLTGEPRSADVFAQTDMVALELTDRHLKGLLANDADVALAMIAELARRLRSLTHDYAEAMHDSSDSVHGHVLGPIDVTTGID